jgi:hypothetical protein
MVRSRHFRRLLLLERVLSSIITVYYIGGSSSIHKVVKEIKACFIIGGSPSMDKLNETKRDQRRNDR